MGKMETRKNGRAKKSHVKKSIKMRSPIYSAWVGMTPQKPPGTSLYQKPRTQLPDSASSIELLIFLKNRIGLGFI